MAVVDAMDLCTLLRSDATPASDACNFWAFGPKVWIWAIGSVQPDASMSVLCPRAFTWTVASIGFPIPASDASCGLLGCLASGWLCSDASSTLGVDWHGTWAGTGID